jgi:hypothetical protein
MTEMKSVRVVGVGLLLGGALMCSFAAEFFRWWMNGGAVSSVFITTISTISPPAAAASGMQLVGGLAFAILCLGVGLVTSAIVYSVLDDFISAAFYALTWIAGLLGTGIARFGRALKERCFPARRFA